MKITWKKLIILPLLFAVAAASLCAQDNPANPAPPAPPAPSALAAQTTATNVDQSQSKKSKDDSDSTPVRIDSTGIHVGGKDPVDISIPGMDRKGGSAMVNEPFLGDSTVPPGAVAVVLIVFAVPFLFLALISGTFIFFKYRRNRMLHETLRVMIDKGVPIPPELIVPPGRQFRIQTNSDLRYGLVFVALGLGILVFHLRLGWIPIFVGLAFLVTWLIEKMQNQKNGQQNK